METRYEASRTGSIRKRIIVTDLLDRLIARSADIISRVYMKFFQRGRGGVQSRRRSDIELVQHEVLLDRIDVLNATIVYLKKQLEIEPADSHGKHRLARGRGTLESQLAAATVERDEARAAYNKLNVPVADARSYGMSAATAGGRKSRRKRTRKRRTKRRRRR